MFFSVFKHFKNIFKKIIEWYLKYSIKIGIREIFRFFSFVLNTKKKKKIISVPVLQLVIMYDIICIRTKSVNDG